jgi:radical SAM/Cys-rich protein
MRPLFVNQQAGVAKHHIIADQSSMKSIPLAPPNSTATLQTRGISFTQTLSDHGLPPLAAKDIRTLQVNIGKLCNQTCSHCHVDAGPTRTENMTLDTIEAILSVVRKNPSIATIDITGGAPEMNPHFEYFVEECRALGRKVIDRCNLTVFFVKGQSHMPQFLAKHQVEIVASLPCYSQDNVDQQRGKGVFDRSIAALQQLNQLGYGKEGTGLILNLVYNPLGPNLPPEQRELELDYKHELRTQFNIEFNQLLTITNMPISRFLDDLKSAGQHEAYMDLLINSFNADSAEMVMCRTLLSVGWDGRLYDCDFHQMLNIPLADGLPQTIHDFQFQALRHRPIVMAQHCFGCTAGAGSSCGGSLL